MNILVCTGGGVPSKWRAVSVGLRILHLQVPCVTLTFYPKFFSCWLLLIFVMSMFIEKGYRMVELPAAMVDGLRSLGITDEDLSAILRKDMGAYK